MELSELEDAALSASGSDLSGGEVAEVDGAAPVLLRVVHFLYTAANALMNV